MHDVRRDAIIAKGKTKKVKPQDHGHAHDEEHKHDHNEEHKDTHGVAAQSEHGQEAHSPDQHSHDHTQDQGHSHDHDDASPHGHEHKHHDTSYENHDDDIHSHSHEHDDYEDRAFTHVHDHGHNFYHAHHHSHHPEHAGLTHKIFNDPVRDWFAVACMGLLIITGYNQWLPGKLSQGILICAAVIGVFPVLKNAFFDSIAKRRPSFELIIGLVLVIGLFMGNFLEVALATLFLLIGSFIRLNFSWRTD
jgi:cation transport ATPase